MGELCASQVTPSARVHTQHSQPQPQLQPQPQYDVDWQTMFVPSKLGSKNDPITNWIAKRTCHQLQQALVVDDLLVCQWGCQQVHSIRKSHDALACRYTHMWAAVKVQVQACETNSGLSGSRCRSTHAHAARVQAHWPHVRQAESSRAIRQAPRSTQDSAVALHPACRWP